MATIHKTKEIINKLPDHKPKLDFLAALLTIPVLITVILINLNALQQSKKNTPIFSLSPVPTSVQKQNPTILIIQATNIPTPSSNATPTFNPTPTLTDTPTPTPTLSPSKIPTPTIASSSATIQ